MLFTGMSFALEPGQSLLLTGPNGAGKSSLLRLLAGLLPVAGGEVIREGAAALADENIALDPALSVRSALAYWARMDGATEEVLEAALDRFALTRIADVPVRLLSTGQRKRAALARVLASGAPIWLLDEPGNGLDTAALGALSAAMDAHVAGGGAIVAASHFALSHPFTATLELEGPQP